MKGNNLHIMRRRILMIRVRWYWVDGSYDEFAVDTMRHAEAMQFKLYKNPDIVSVEIISCY